MRNDRNWLCAVTFKNSDYTKYNKVILLACVFVSFYKAKK